jgi:hypothetical protein
MQFGSFALDTLWAPKLSLLTSCGAPEVASLPNYGGSLRLNQLFSSAKYKEPVKVLLSNFVGRLSTAVEEYRAGRDHLLSYVAALPQHDRLRDHRRAVSHFESCILHGYTAIVCLAGVGRILQIDQRIFVHGDGSDYDRLRLLNNRIKHFDEDVEDAARAGTTSIPVAPVWITNDALESTAAVLRFCELAEILQVQSKDAEAFSQNFFKDALEQGAQASASQSKG